jgi:hypothetical protein
MLTPRKGIQVRPLVAIGPLPLARLALPLGQGADHWSEVRILVWIKDRAARRSPCGARGLSPSIEVRTLVAIKD